MSHVKTFIVTRDVTRMECHWLAATVRKGTTVYPYNGATYGCIGDGKPFMLSIGGDFFELPDNSVTEIQEPVTLRE